MPGNAALPAAVIGKKNLFAVKELAVSSSIPQIDFDRKQNIWPCKGYANSCKGRAEELHCQSTSTGQVGECSSLVGNALNFFRLKKQQQKQMFGSEASFDRCEKLKLAVYQAFSPPVSGSSTRMSMSNNRHGISGPSPITVKVALES